VSLMKVEKVPDSTYDMIGGLDQQIKEIKEVIPGARLPAAALQLPAAPSACGTQATMRLATASAQRGTHGGLRAALRRCGRHSPWHP